MKKGRIFHLEDHSEWLKHIQDLLGEEYDLYSATNEEDAAKLFWEMAAEGMKFDLAIVDISLVLGDSEDKQGFKFLRELEKSGVMYGHNIIVLTGYPDVDDNLRVAFRDYDVQDVFDKANFVEERHQFKQRIEEIIDRLHS